MGSTRDTLKRRVRKTVKWGGAVLTVLLVVVWIGSAWWGVWWTNREGGTIEVARGQLGITGSNFVRGWGSLGLVEFLPHDRLLQGWFDWVTFLGQRIVVIPLWFPALLSLLATAAAWRADMKYLRRARVGLCAGCGYDRAGLAAGAVCPECGKQAEGR